MEKTFEDYTLRVVKEDLDLWFADLKEMRLFAKGKTEEEAIQNLKRKFKEEFQYV